MIRFRFTALMAAAALFFTVGATLTAQVYPLKKSPKLTYWMGTHRSWDTRFKNLGETPFGKELSTRTGVTIEWISPPSAQATQNFNLMLASGDLPDLIENDLYSLPGGPEKLIKDGYILSLNDAMKKWAPNLMAYLKANPEVDKMVKTDSGKYFGFPFIRGDEYLMVFQGPMIRKDWLDELGLAVPETIDDWTKVLTAFKDKKGATAPFTSTHSSTFGDWYNASFAGAYGAIKDWYVEDGKVKYGPAEPQYKQFLQLLSDWYKAGLIDPNIAMTNKKARDALLVEGKCGAIIGNTGGDLGYVINLMKDKDPKAKWVAAPYPVLKKGDKAKFGQRDFPVQKWVVAISAKTKNLEAAVRFLDYGYSQEGSMFFNFGTSGVSYNMVNGYPTYSELVTKNPKLSMAEAIGENARGNYGGPFVQDKRYMEQYAALPEQKDSINIWAKTDMAKYKMPFLAPAEKDTNEMSKIMSEIETYTKESFVKFVIGAEPMSGFDNYIATLKKLNVDRAIAIYQTSYTAFSKR